MFIRKKDIHNYIMDGLNFVNFVKNKIRRLMNQNQQKMVIVR